MISVLDTSDYSILWTVPNNPYDVMGAWVPRSLSAHVGDGQWLSGIQHLIRYGGFSLKKMSLGGGGEGGWLTSICCAHQICSVFIGIKKSGE